MPVTLYKLDSENNMTEVETTVTDKDGKYIFKNLNVGRYKIRVNFDNSVYDLTLRYARYEYWSNSKNNIWFFYK